MSKFSKKILIIICIPIALFGLVFGVALLNLNSIITLVKPQLEATISKTVGTEVGIGKMHASLFPSLHLQLEEMALGGEKSPDLTVGGVTLNVKLLPILSKKLEITELSIEKPTINVTRSQNGISLRGLPAPSGRVPKSEDKPLHTEGEQTENRGTPIAILLERFSVKGGSVTINDEILRKTVRIRDLDLTASVNVDGARVILTGFKGGAQSEVGQSLETGSFEPLGPLSLEAATFEFDQAAKVLSLPKGMISIFDNNLSVGSIYDLGTQSGKVSVNAQRIDLSSLLKAGKLFVPLPPIELSGKAKLDGNFKFSENSATGDGALELHDLHLAINGQNVTNAALQSSFRLASKNELTVTIPFFSATCNGEGVTSSLQGSLIDSKVGIRELQLKGFNGAVGGSLSFHLATKEFQTDLSGGGIAIPQLLHATIPSGAPPVEGIVEKFSLRVAGTLGAHLVESLQGPASVTVINSSLKGINIARETLGKLDQIPFVSGALLLQVPPEFQSLLNAESTVLQRLEIALKLQNGKAHAESIQVLSNLFALAGGGEINLQSKEVALVTTLFFEPRLSLAIVNRVKELKILLDDKGSFTVPLVLKGIPPKLLVLPDGEKIAQSLGKRLVREKAKEAVQDLLEKKGGDKGKELLKGLLGF